MAGHVAMSADALTGTMADWIALWRLAMAAQELRYWEVDERAGLGDGYMAKLMCGQVQSPTWPTIVKINRALGISLYAERAALMP
jgi:hypothetical protein